MPGQDVCECCGYFRPVGVLAWTRVSDGPGDTRPCEVCEVCIGIGVLDATPGDTRMLLRALAWAVNLIRDDLREVRDRLPHAGGGG